MKLGMSGEDVAAIIGMHPNKTAHDVYNESLELFVNLEEPTINDRMIDTMIQWYSEQRTDSRTIRTDPMFGEWEASFAPAIVVDINGKDIGVIITATALRGETWGFPDTDDIPELHLIRAHWSMMVHDVLWCNVVAHVAGEFVIYKINRDIEFNAQLHEVASEFWHKHIKILIPPAPDSSNACMERLSAFKVDIGYIEADEDMDRLALKLKVVTQSIDDLSLEKKELKAKLATILGSSGRKIVGEWGSLFWDNPKITEKTDWKAICDEIGVNDEVYQKYTHSTRRKPSFKAKFKKDEIQ